MTLTVGTKLGPYEIVAPLGAGGMGEVYRALDTRLDREVAVKVLPEEMARNPDARARFEREAKAVAALSHPNILAVYDVGREQDVSYVVTELLDGETLRERLQGQALQGRKALEIGIAVSDGLAAAHAKGIVHRDLKPENIFITNDGVVKILDFGLARWDPPGAPAEQAAYTPTITLHTSPGTVLGTVNYMAPEQIRGQRTDARSDIFAFGCVLYEMVTGRRAFTGETSADTMTAILREVPQTVRSVRADAGPELERVIDRCLDKKAEHRFQSSQDLAFTLRAILSDSGSVAAVDAKPRMWGFAVPVAVAAVTLLAAAAFLLVRGWPSSRQSAAGPIDSLAVLPFSSAGDAQNTRFLSEGIAESVINSLLNVENLRVVPRATAFQHGGREDELEHVADELGVRAIVTGRVIQQGDRLVVSTELMDVLEERQLWGHRYDASRADILEIERDLARQISDALRLTLSGAELARRDKQYTDDPQARIAYLEGRYWWNKRTGDAFERALEKFNEAITLDPDYALAHTALADTYILMGFYSHAPREVFPLAEQSIARAIAIDPSLTEVHLSKAGLNFFYKWNWAEAERAAKRAVELDPRSAQAYHWYGVILAGLGRPDESQRMLEKAREVDPGYFIAQVDLAAPYILRGDWETATAITERVVGMDPNFARARERLAMCYMAAGRHDEAIREARKAAELSGRTGRFATALAKTLAAAGRREEAMKELERVKDASINSYVPPLCYAGTYALLGDKETAFEYLEQALEERDAAMGVFGIDFESAGLHDDPRFAEILRRVGLPADRFEFQTDLRRQASNGADVDAGKVRLAVLPFRDLSPEPQEWFCETMTDAVNFDLGQISGLSVVPNPSVRRYRESRESISTIGTSLDVTHLVYGNVTRDDAQVQIRVRMFDAKSEQQIWAERFDRPSGDYLGIQNEVARAIASAVRVSLTPDDEKRLTAPASVDPRAYQNYMLGMSFVRQQTRQSLRTALKHFDDAIARDPDFALAYAGRAAAYQALANEFDAPRDAMPQVKEAAQKALALDPNCVDAVTELGYYALVFEWDWEEARKSFERAVALDQTHARARVGLAMYLMAMNRSEEALRQLDIVREHSDTVQLVDSNYGFIAIMARKYPRAIREAEEALDADPNWWAAHMWLGVAYSLNGEHDRAIQHMQTLVRLTGGPGHRAMEGGVLAVAGGEENRAEAWSIYQDLKANEDTQYVCPYELATIPLGLGNHDLAFEEMNRACEARADCLAWLQVDARLDPIRDDPRFDALLRRVGFEPQSGLEVEPATTEPITLAVLPFANDSGDAELDYLSDGITESLINSLSRLDRLRVIPRSTVFWHHNEDADPIATARNLSATALLTGRVLKRAERLTIQADLADVTENRQLWGERYEREFADLVEIERAIAKEITDALQLRLTGEEQTMLSRGHTQDTEAYRLYLRGRFFWNKRSVPDLRRAITYFKEAIERDPDYAQAWAGLADVHLVLPFYSDVPSAEEMPKARAAAERALRIDENLAEAHATLAFALALYDWDWSGSDREFRRALELNPKYAHALKWYTEVLSLMGQQDEAMDTIERAAKLDPLSPNIQTIWGLQLWIVGRDAEALARFDKALELDPDFPLALMHKCWLCWTTGDVEGFFAARQRLEKVSAVANVPVSELRRAHATGGREAVVRMVLASDEAGRSPIERARWHTSLGELDAAFDDLEQALEERAVWLPFTAHYHLRELRTDPRYDALRARLGLPDMD